MIAHPRSSSRASCFVARLFRPGVLAAFAIGVLTPFSRNAAASDGGLPLTGTHIRGTADSAYSISTYNRDEIESSGASSLQQFIQTLPQNFNGGASENTLQSISGGGNAINAVEGTAANLRGLGNDSTLILVNGHRVAAGNTQGNFVDLSLIPLYAVERIEVVTDGASAIYGSDAVGGVVNIILGRNMEGAETRARFGAVNSGGTRDTQVGQTLAHGWDTGYALGIYEFSDRTPLDASARNYTRSAPAPFMLLPEQVRHSAFVSLDDEVAPGIQLLAEGTYAHRSTYDDRAPFNIPLRARAVIDAYGASTGARLDLPRGAQLELIGAYTANDSNYEVIPAGALTPSVYERARSTILSIDAKLDGRLFSLPAGNVVYAVGAQFRQEDFSHADLLAMTEFRPSRHVEAAFLELRVPLIGAPGSTTPAANRLEVTLADRDEHYSDFGPTNNPQIGLILRPSPELKFRATYGTSFRAPLLHDLNPVPFQVVPLPEFDPSTAGVTNTLAIFGGNQGLKPEKARTWTAGLEVAIPSMPDFHLSATYYDIRFTDLITDPEFSVDVSNVLSQEALLGPAIIERQPSAARVQQLAASPGYANFFGIDLASIGAIFDSRVHNLSSVRTTGLDFNGSWATATSLGNVELGLDGTYIFRFDNQFTNNAPVNSILNTAYNPVNLRMRARTLIRTIGGLTFGLFTNYTNAYRENNTISAQPVASWTTVDVTARYLFTVNNGPLADTSLLVAITNVTGKNPPFVPNALGINFDGANANAFGRVVSVQLSKRW
ncbi:MAG: TonB-dependent receptor plug domain-containing protein [Steroidobacteraceae bacterium]